MVECRSRSGFFLGVCSGSGSGFSYPDLQSCFVCSPRKLQFLKKGFRRRSKAWIRINELKSGNPDPQLHGAGRCCDRPNQTLRTNRIWIRPSRKKPISGSNLHELYNKTPKFLLILDENDF